MLGKRKKIQKREKGSAYWQNVINGDVLLESKCVGILQHLFTNKKNTPLTLVQVSHSKGISSLSVNLLSTVTFQTSNAL